MNRNFLKAYKSTVCVNLFVAKAVTDPHEGRVLVSGYYQTLIVGAETEENARFILEQFINDGTIDWNDSDINLDFEHSVTVPHEGGKGVLFASGKAFFPQED